MKLVLIIPLLFFFASCASRQKPRLHLAPIQEQGSRLPQDKVASVRYPESIKAYRFGRYVDPGNRRVMHEAHTVYRQETTPRWNLNTSASVPTSPSPAAPSPPEPLRDELLMELNRQRQATRTVVQSGAAVSSKLEEVSKALRENQKLAAQTSLLQEAVEQTNQRLDALESQLSQSASIPGEPEPEFTDTHW